MTLRETILRGIDQYRDQGYVIRKYTPEEISERVSAMSANHTVEKQSQLPLAKRLSQVRRVNALKEQGKLQYEACNIVGITEWNYKRLRKDYADKL